MFWSNVKKLLSEKKILQKDFASMLEINIATLKNQMTRNIIPDAETAVKIASVLSTTVEFLVTGQESDPAIKKSDELKEKIIKEKIIKEKIIEFVRNL